MTCVPDGRASSSLAIASRRMASASCLVGLLIEDFRLDDRDEPVAEDLSTDFELLLHDGGDAGLIRIGDYRAHLGTEDALLHRAGEQGIEIGHRLHQLHTILLGGQPLINFEERHHTAILPQIGRDRLALGLAIHGLLEQDGGDDLVAGKTGRCR